MEPEGSLPHSEVPATSPYPEPGRSNPYPQIPLLENPLVTTVSLEVSSAVRV